MEFIAAAMLLNNNNEEVNKLNISKLFNSISTSFTDESMELFLEKINGKSFEELISAGSELMKSKFVGSAAAPTAAATAKVEAKEEVKEESTSSDVIDFL